MSSNMSSTEFTSGKEDGRNSSRVLKPPGGGSSDIFNVGPYVPTTDKNQQKNVNPAIPQEETTKTHGGKRESLDTMERVFNVPKKSENEAATPQAPSSYATRNPITGEGIELEKLKKKEGHEKDLVARNPITGEGFEVDQCPEKDLGKGAGPANPEALFKPVQTSVRVRNPSGGKSSGIF